MRDPFQWSIGLGRWGGVAIRVHVFFLAFAAATFFFAIPDVLSLTAWWMAGGNMLGIASATVAILFVSVLMHELSHWLVARHAGIRLAAITIGPLGGLTPWRFRVGPRSELAILVAGPLTNLLLALLLLVAILVWPHSDVNLRSLLNPLQPAGTLAVTQQLVAIGLWINWLLFVLNVLPAHPFDGRRILHAALRLGRPAWSDRRASEWVCGVAIALAVTVVIVAMVVAKYYADPNHSDTPFPIWAALVLLAAVLLASARREMEDVEVPVLVEEPVASEDDEGDAERGATPLADPQFLEPPVADALWESDPDESDEPVHPEEMEAEEERLVDGILSRLHAHGIDSLTVDERALLHRVSARYRSRLGKRM